ncbi:hypothetical protein N665_0086s0070 [Sinapis alba]|nr:hypothetical protein N665_0086s0070 [Sinapis alba]
MQRLFPLEYFVLGEPGNIWLSFLMNQHITLLYSTLILGETGSIFDVVVKMYISLEFSKKRSHVCKSK